MIIELKAGNPDAGDSDLRHGSRHVFPVFEVFDIKRAFQDFFVDQIVPEHGVAEHFLQDQRNIAAAQIVGIQRPELLVIRENHVDDTDFIFPFQFRTLLAPCLVTVGIVAQVHKVIVDAIAATLVFDQVFFAAYLLLPEEGGYLLSQLLTGGPVCHRRPARQIRTPAPVTAGKVVYLQEGAVLFPEFPVMQIDVECPVVAGFQSPEIITDLDVTLLSLIQNSE